MSFTDFMMRMKLYQMRAQSHTGYVVTALSLAVAIATYMKVSNLSGWYSVGIFGGIVGANLLIGYLDVRYRLFSKEISLNNTHNPELQEILRILKEERKK